MPEVLNGSLMKKEIFAILKYPYTKYLKTPTGENVAYMKNSRKYLNQELGESGGSSVTWRPSMASRLPGSLALGLRVSALGNSGLRSTSNPTHQPSSWAQIV